MHVQLMAACALVAIAGALLWAGTRAASAGSTPAPATTLSNTLYLPLLLRPSINYLPLVARPQEQPQPQPPAVTPTQFGFDFISSAESPADSTRYQRAAIVRAQVNRWPFYWPSIETNAVNQPGVYDWSKQDANAIADINQGLSIDAILMLSPNGISTAGNPAVAPPRVGAAPRFAPQPMDVSAVSSSTSPPQGLYSPVFADGSDVPGPNKAINANNPWARFVYAAVNRYKPGGVLAQQQGWGQGQGIRVWEVWNEPDFDFFFSGTYTDYARLLKVAYLAAHQADPGTKVLFGGKANFQKPTWLADTLRVIATYPDRNVNGWFFDAVATHWYSAAEANYNQLLADRQTLDSFGLTGKTLWLNETGVPVWDDPPGPTWDPRSPYRATMQEQAAYVIQVMTWAIWTKTEAALYFQEYDDYGNGCPGYDAFGLVRNPPNFSCNAESGTPRPGYAAYGVVTQYLAGAVPYWRLRPTPNQELVALQNPGTQQRVIAMWARFSVTETTSIPATSSSATLVFPDGTTQTITPAGGVYNITLPWATNYNSCFTCPYPSIGGMPRILVERDPNIRPGAIELPSEYDAK